MDGIQEIELPDGSIQEFPADWSDAQIKAALVKNKLIPETPAPGGPIDSGTPLGKVDQQVNPMRPETWLPELGKDLVGGVEKGLTNLLNVSTQLNGVQGLNRALGVLPTDEQGNLMKASDRADAADGLGGMVGRMAPSLAVPAGAGTMLTGAVAGAAETGTGEGAVGGALLGKAGEKLLGLGLGAGKAVRTYLASKAARGAAGETLSTLPGVKPIVETVKKLRDVAQPEQMLARKAAERTTIEAGEEQFAREVLAKAERQTDLQKARPFLQEEKAHTAARAANREFDEAADLAATKNRIRLEKEAKRAGAAEQKAQQDARKAGESDADDFDLDLEAGKAEARARSSKIDGAPEGPRKPSFDEKLRQKGLATKGESEPIRPGGPKGTATKKLEAKRAVEEKPKKGRTPKQNVDPENPSEAYRNRRNPNWKPRSEWMENQQQKAVLINIEKELTAGNHAKARILAKDLGLSSTEIKQLFKDFK